MWAKTRAGGISGGFAEAFCRGVCYGFLPVPYAVKAAGGRKGAQFLDVVGRNVTAFFLPKRRARKRHVFSPKYRVAAVGNVTTRPLSRGRGFATAATAAVCKNLFADVDIIGLNVRQDNATAIACYRKLGFDVVGEFEEYLAVRR